MRGLFLLLLFISLSAQAVEIAEPQFFGPLRVRNMTPFSILRLDPLPDHSVNGTQRGWALEMHLSTSNTFVASKNVRNYLAQRAIRAPLRPDDVQNIMGLPGDVYYFDGSISLLNITMHKVLSENFAGFITVPVYHYSGGALDKFIENFHEATGIGSFDRNYAAQNNFQIVMRLSGDKLIALTAPETNALGDPIAGLRYAWQLDRDQYLTFVGLYKVAIADEENYFSSGSNDYGAEISYQYKDWENAFYVSVGYVHAGESALFPEATRETIPSITLAWESRLGPHTNFVAQFNATQGTFQSSTDEELVQNAYQITLGLRHQVGNIIWSYALTENLINFDNSADLGFHIGFSLIFAE